MLYMFENTVMSTEFYLCSCRWLWKISIMLENVVKDSPSRNLWNQNQEEVLPPPPPLLFCSLHISEISVHVAFYPIYCTNFCQLNSDHCQNKETEGMVLPEVI